ncbi:MAG TPA: sigma-70 family RNA polymerase sigma factor [Candidatus Paceibacterota bacterium]|nr:sigma-70 family RNA polymerase sigma factor [Candidatus Paceibacterota bacterium]
MERFKNYLNYKNLTFDKQKTLLLNKNHFPCREMVIESYLKLVFSIFDKNFIVKDIEIKNDLIHSGIIGLIEAVDRCDGKKPENFSSYASSYILNEMRSFLRKNAFLCYVPEYKVYEVFKIKKMQEKPESKNKHTNMLLEYKSVSIEDVQIPEEPSLSNIDVDFLLSQVNSLDIDDKKILHLRYVENKSWRNIGGKIGMTYEGARKKHGRILDKLKSILIPEKIKTI